MNFLGHLYFSGAKKPLMLANLYGDFVKGKDYSYLPDIVEKGVSLHRNIDDYIDHHPKVTELRLELYRELPKIAGIAIDLYFDHLLAKNWQNYHATPLSKFTGNFMDFATSPEHWKFDKNNFHYSPEFIHLIQMMNQHDWLNRYAQLEGLEMASQGLSSRISFDNNLHEAVPVFRENESKITTIFEEYMEDARQKFKIFLSL